MVKYIISNGTFAKFCEDTMKTWKTLSTFLRFFDMTLQKSKKSRFLDFEKKRILELCPTNNHNHKCTCLLIDIWCQKNLGRKISDAI